MGQRMSILDISRQSIPETRSSDRKSSIPYECFERGIYLRKIYLRKEVQSYDIYLYNHIIFICTII